jgi:hypothetical protein
MWSRREGPGRKVKVPVLRIKRAPMHNAQMLLSTRTCSNCLRWLEEGAKIAFATPELT